MGDISKRCAWSMVAVALMVACPGAARGQDIGLEHFVTGVEFFDAPDYEQAANAFQKAVDREPDNLEYRFYLGLSLKALDRFDESLAIFDAIVARAPTDFVRAYLEMASIHTHHQRHQQALDVLAAGARAAPDNARIILEKGFVFRIQGDYDQAVASFQRAGEMDADLLQAALYNVAAVYFEQKQFDRARDMFEQAIAVDPQSPAAVNARRSMDNIANAQRATRRAYFSASLGWGVNSNIPLDPRQGALGRPLGLPSEKDDQFQILSLNGGYRIIGQEDLELGVGYRLRSIGYQDWYANNLTGHRPYISLRVTEEPLVFRFSYEFSEWYSGGSDNLQDSGLFITLGNDADRLLQGHGFTSRLQITEPHDLQSDITLDYQIKRYFDGISSDSQRYAAEFLQSWKIPGTESFPRLGVTYVSEKTDAAKESYDYFLVRGGVSMPLVWDIAADLALTYAWITYAYNPAYKVSGERGDRQWRVVASLTRPLGDRLHLTAYYDHTGSDSDVLLTGADPYEFTMDIYSLMLTFVF